LSGIFPIFRKTKDRAKTPNRRQKICKFKNHTLRILVQFFENPLIWVGFVSDSVVLKARFTKLDLAGERKSVLRYFLKKAAALSYEIAYLEVA
jgi:hypothetical protein